MSRLILLLPILFFATPFFGQPAGKDPSFEEVISLRYPGNIAISPDGRHVAFTVGSTDWKDNRFDTEIWLSKDGGRPFPLTRTTGGSSGAPVWSPDGQWIAFTAKRAEHEQIFVIRMAGGEAFPLTKVENNIGRIEWSPDGKRIAFTMEQPEPKSDKKREERYGKYAVEDQEYKLNWLYAVDFDPDRRSPEELPCYDAKDSSAQAWDCLSWPEVEALIDSVDFTVSNFRWSPDGRHIAVQHQPDPLINSWFKADVSLIEVGTKTLKPFLNSSYGESLLAWSPDSKFILYSRGKEDANAVYYQNALYFKVPVGGGAPTPLATSFDEELYGFSWTQSGIFAGASQRTERHLFRIDPGTGNVQRWATPQPQMGSFSFTPAGDRIAFSASNGDDLSEVYVSPVAFSEPAKITDFTSQITDWQVAASEVLSWKSRDGATIEGVLHKPQDYDASKKYPLLVVIHGGPTGVDRPSPVPAYVYPIVQWLNKGALVLRVNYRGSAGYGEAFRSLNVRNLGVGDAWDVLSGVDHLDQEGLIDTSRMGCMGWSQGGYISAFLTTTTNRFKAISVGAGISDWTTYYVNTDIHPFTRQYLKATPWDDPDIYAKTSPMTYIKDATTPSLIQHGENDQRVPIPNAYKLLQGLEDEGVPAKLVVYKGFGHGITKPKERLAAMWHNWQWFNKYLWEEEVEMPGME